MSCYMDNLLKNNDDLYIGKYDDLEESFREYAKKELKEYKDNLSIAKDVDLAISELSIEKLKLIEPDLDSMSKIMYESKQRLSQKREDWIEFERACVKLSR